MMEANLRLRPAVLADQQQIADLILFQQQVHRHLDWRTPLEWLGCQPYLVLEKDGCIAAALACPPDPPAISWIRLFVFDSNLSDPSAWPPLWHAARRELASQQATKVAAITTQPWFESILTSNGFVSSQSIVMLEWNRQTLKPWPVPAGITLRPMTASDLPCVADVDAASFEPLWQNSLPALSKAFSQALYASVAENESGFVGYQLSTGNPLGAHLARLAVRPEAQGRGIASALIGDLMHQACRAENLSRITVNTQSDNASSLGLYGKMGFRKTGEQYPVYIYQAEV
ncbi:MAG TPA: GNAT family N-acetyltransferase [Anaerolineales bacterium]|nr:GNAT family N-acetyltransferase [Anaerolineales bacterium]